MTSHDKKRLALIQKQAGKPGYKGKVAAKCIECLVDLCQPGSWRQQVENCSSPTCPLYEVRPTTLGNKNDHEDKEIVGVQMAFGDFGSN